MLNKRVAASMLILMLVAACGGGGGSSSAPPINPPANTLNNLVVTADAQLSPGNVMGQDEDPAVVRTANALNVAWFSDRNGNQADGVIDREIFLLRSTDGRAFSGPTQITRATRYSFTPRMAVDAQDQLQLVWWRVIPAPVGCTPNVDCTQGTINKVLYKHANANGDFNIDDEQIIADGPGDWLPSIVVDKRNGQLRVYFVSPVRNAQGVVDLALSTSRIFVVVFDGTSWSAPVMVQGVNADTSHNTYPQVIQRDDNTFLITWTRYGLGNRNFDPPQVVNEPTAETWYGESTDGVNFTATRQLSDAANGAADVFPVLYRDHNGVWFALWQSGGVGVVEAPLSGATAFQRVRRAEIVGDQPQVLATPTTGVFWSVSVDASLGRGRERIHHRFFQKP